MKFASMDRCFNAIYACMIFDRHQLFTEKQNEQMTLPPYFAYPKEKIDISFIGLKQRANRYECARIHRMRT